MPSLDNPKVYYETLILPAFNDWFGSMDNMKGEYKFRGLCIYLDSMADVVWNFKYKHSYNSSWKYREHIIGKYKEFRMIQDIANATKHVELNRNNPVYKHINMLFISSYNSFDEIDQIDELICSDQMTFWAIKDENGKVFPVYKSIKIVMDLWKKEF